MRSQTSGYYGNFYRFHAKYSQIEKQVIGNQWRRLEQRHRKEAPIPITDFHINAKYFGSK
ncbi:hypothetical protein V1477_001619 [Vespula maculifrons]|uniref:Uncharacterized protein n=1 Tax=Vespula maculifrons TaxID=7453 RepID=A0ABD2D150_VESMC